MRLILIITLSTGDRSDSKKPLPGWVPGVSIALGYQNPQVFRVGLRAGFGYHFEIMGGVWQDPRPLMDVGIESAWYIR